MDSDALLQRIERTALVICLAMAALALVIARGRPAPAVGVLGGGFLTGVSYWTIRSAVTALVEALTRGTAAGRGVRTMPGLLWTLVKVGGRYALLAILAYVMIARLRLHPLGLLAGASSVVAAASVEAVRLFMKQRS